MSINLETLIPYNQILESPEDVFDLVDEHGQVILLQDNAPAYIIMKAEASMQLGKPNDHNHYKKTEYKLQEAMKIVLSETEGNKMRAADLADAIFQRGLYFKKDGTKAEYNQIRARCSHYPDLFEALPGNIIKLKETGAEELIAAVSNFEIGKIYTNAEITQAYRDYGGAKSEPLPSDYCYNCSNAGIDFYDRSRRLFEKVERGKYKYLGPDYLYSGEVTHTDRYGNTKLFGKWDDGEFIPIRSINRDNSEEDSNMEGVSKFIGLERFLNTQANDSLSLTFEEIERITGEKLYPSAYKYDAYWRPSKTHVLPNLIIDCGYKIEKVDLKNKIIELKR